MSLIQNNLSPPRAAVVEAGSIKLGELVSFYLNILRRGWHLIAISIVLSLFATTIYLISAIRLYEATTRLLVLQQGGRPISVASNDPTQTLDRSDDYLPTQALIISSPIVVARAIENVGLNECPSLQSASKSGQNVVTAAIERLNVTRPDRYANFLNVSYRAYSPAEAERILRAITESYQSFLGDSYQKNSTEAITLITKARDEVNVELEKLKEEYRKFRQENQTLLADEKGRSFASIQLEQIYRAANEAKLKTSTLKVQLEMATKMANERVSLWAIAHAIEQFGSGTNQSLIANSLGLAQSGTSLDHLRQLSVEQQKLVEEFGPQNTRVQEINELMERAQVKSRETQKKLEQGEAKDLIASLSMSLKAIEGLQEDFKKDFSRGLKEAKEIEYDLLVEADLRDRVERASLLFASVVEQLKQAEFVSDYTTIRSQIMEPPNAIEKAVSPRIGITLAIALVLGSVVGVAATVAAEHLDQRLRSIEEIRTTFNLPILGVIPQFDSENISRISSPGLVALELPESTWAESYRALRTNLDSIRRRHFEIQVILISSPCSGDGKSTTSSNLANMIANTGKKVLLIDADLRRPSQRGIYKVLRNVGLSQILLRTATFEEARLPTVNENLTLLVSGSYELNPAELLASNEFVNVMQELRGKFDVIILDTPPLLAVSDSAIVSALVDGIVLVVGPGNVRKHDAEQTLEILASLGTPTLGLIINRATRQALGGGGYGYGYGYGYGGASYGSGLRYGYGYGASRKEDSDSEKESNSAAASSQGESPENRDLSSAVKSDGSVVGNHQIKGELTT